jgi:hypothetical protein
MDMDLDLVLGLWLLNNLLTMRLLDEAGFS